MAAPNPPDDNSIPNDWGPQDDHSMGPTSNGQGASGQSLPIDDRPAIQDPENPDYPRGSSVGDNEIYREKQIKPNKVYIGGLPEHTRQEDLQNCFGKIGRIVNIELKVGYGFVEFDNREAAEESVSKYHDGYFMGNRIRVELSHGGGRTAKYAGDPGACFKCGELGHWARECPNGTYPQRRQQNYDAPLIDRIQRDYPPPPRSLGPRDDYPPRPTRDSRYDYPAPGPIRDHRRPPSPREYRDYPPAPVRVRDYDDYRRGPAPPLDRDRYGPPPEARGRYPPPDPTYRNYGPPPPPPPAAYDRYERRPNDRYGYTQPTGPRGRTPPRVRDEYERPQPPPPPPPARDYGDYRARPPSPVRYPPEYGRSGYRRRSESPPPRQGVPYEPYPMNGYGPPSGPPPPVSVPPRGSRDYPPAAPPRSRDSIEPGPYRRP
ncbi:hypothetical protein CVT24_005010 [Panaeolus cyanescens]|uniref:RNA-binding domain-containing protein n=1 Tax=Panaeolus cyanescens TaxID=181874 RepID=A0A409YB85_9AGAR|nr:hypothetical protein CVT24_005010 [Panaeolus cyanescens]